METCKLIVLQGLQRERDSKAGQNASSSSHTVSDSLMPASRWQRRANTEKKGKVKEHTQTYTCYQGSTYQ